LAADNLALLVSCHHNNERLSPTVNEQTTNDRNDVDNDDDDNDDVTSSHSLCVSATGRI